MCRRTVAALASTRPTLATAKEGHCGGHGADDLLHQPGRRLYVEHEYNGVDLEELAADVAHAGFSSLRVVEAIEETQHADG